MTDHNAPERIMASACGKAIVTTDTALPGDVEYIRADLHRAEVETLVAAYQDAATLVDKAWPSRNKLKASIGHRTPTDARAALRAHTEAAVRRALEGAARFVDCGCEPARKAAVLSAPPNSGARWRSCGNANCGAMDAADIRALAENPAQFIGGGND